MMATVVVAMMVVVVVVVVAVWVICEDHGADGGDGRGSRVTQKNGDNDYSDDLLRLAC